MDPGSLELTRPKPDQKFDLHFAWRCSAYLFLPVLHIINTEEGIQFYCVYKPRYGFGTIGFKYKGQKKIVVCVLLLLCLCGGSGGKEEIETDVKKIMLTNNTIWEIYK